MTADPARLSDSELLAAYAAGREEAFAEVARRHGAMVWRAARRVLGDEHEAEDAAQAAFLVLARRARSFRRGGDLAGWLHGIAVRTALEARRARAARRRRDEEAATMARREESGGADPLERAEALGRLDAELARLPALERQAVLLRHLEARPQQEAARLAGCPVGTLSRRAADGLERLRERLARRGETLGGLALAGLLGAEACGAVPETLLPSLLAVPKLAAAGAAAGVAGLPALASAKAGGTLAVTLAEGVLKAMFWTKVKLAAAVLVAAVAVGVSSPLVYRAAAGDATAAGLKTAPAGTPEAARGPEGPAPAEAQAVDGLKLRIVKSTEAAMPRDAKEAGDRVRQAAAACRQFRRDTGRWPARPGELAERKHLEFAAFVRPGRQAPEDAAEADRASFFRIRGEAGPDRQADVLVEEIPDAGRPWIWVGQVDGTTYPAHPADRRRWFPTEYLLSWENVAKEPLTVLRARSQDLEGRVFLRGPNGRMARSRLIEKLALEAQTPVRIERGAFEQEPFDPWHWVEKPDAPGDYALWVEFEQSVKKLEERQGGLNATPGKGFWTGKVRSNELKVRVEDPTAGQAVNGLQVGGVAVRPAEWVIPEGKGSGFEDVLADLLAHKPLDDKRGQGIFSFTVGARFTNTGKTAFRLQTDIIQLGIELRDEEGRKVNIAQMFIPGPSKDAPFNFPVLKPGATLPMTITGHLLTDGRVLFEFASRNDLRMVEHSAFPLTEGRYRLRVTSQNGFGTRGGGTEFDFADDFWTGSVASGEVTVTVKKRPTLAPAPAGPSKPPGEIF